MMTFGSNLPMQVLGGISGLLTPTLKFRFTPEEVLNCQEDCRFENDPYYSGLAYRTSQKISASQLGITGSLLQGLNKGLLDRMSEFPGKAVGGGLLLITGALVARATYSYFKKASSPDNAENQAPKPSFLSYENFKQKAKRMTSACLWTSLIVTTIFFNTL